MQRRLLILGAAAMLVAAAVQAEEKGPPKYGVVSLLGESISVTGTRPTTGSRIDQSDKIAIAVPDAGFDATALRTIEETVKQLAPQSSTMLFAIKAPNWVDNPAGLFDGSKVLMSPKLIAAMKADGATHLLLLTRHNAEVQLRFEDRWETKGRAEGLGFYIDRQLRVINSTSRETSVGYLAPHANMRLSLVDLGTATVVSQQIITASNIFSPSLKQTSADPWQSLDGKQKLVVLNTLIEDALKNALPPLLAVR